MELAEVFKWLLGGTGLTTLIGWNYKRVTRLENRIHSVEQQLATRPTEKATRQLIQDLQAPVKTDMEYIKSETDKQSKKLDMILEKLLKDK